MAVPKYVLDSNNIPKLNPNYKDDSLPPPPPSYAASKLAQSMPIVSTMADQVAMNEITNLPIPQQSVDAMNRFKGPAYTNQFNAVELDGERLFDGITNLFQRLSIPFGFMEKLMGLQNSLMHFKVDDSGSMRSSSGLTLPYACPYMQEKLLRAGHSRHHTLTRWEEAQDRLHSQVELLAYVPTGDIKLSFFDHPDTGPGAERIISRAGRTPEEFTVYAHAQIDAFFNRPLPSVHAGTPILENLVSMERDANLRRGNGDLKVLNYVISDGEPNGGRNEIFQIKNFLRSINISLNPFTFLGCSNNRAHYEWMHEMEVLHPEGGVSALADYPDELDDVLRDQGITFPYVRGIWLICSLVAVLFPNDLDCLDHGAPLPKQTLERLWARGMPEQEYQQYFMNHPGAAARAFGADYQLFLTTQNINQIPSVKVYNDAVIQYLNRDINNGEDDSENRADYYGKQAVIKWRASQVPVYSGGNASTVFQPASSYAQQRPVAPPPQQDTCCRIV